MNKKNLSVVLAGAMLATSVAPVLAETTASKEYTTEQFALLTKEIVAKMKTKMISNYAAIKTIAGTEVAKLMQKDKSAFGVKVVGKDGKDLDLTTLGVTGAASTTLGSKVKNNVTYDINAVSKILDAKTNAAKLDGCTIQIVERKTTNFKGQVIPGTEITKVEGTEVVYDEKTDFHANKADAKFDASSTLGTALDMSNNKYISAIEGVGTAYDESTDKEDSTPGADSYFKRIKIVTNKLEDGGDANSNLVINLDGTSKKIDGTLPLDAEGNVLDYKSDKDVSKLAKFETVSQWKASETIVEAPTNVDSYKITSVTDTENMYKASDLYDGLALTAKGTELAADLQNAADLEKTAANRLVKISAVTKSAVNKFTIHYYKTAALAAKDTTVDGKDDNGNHDVVAYKTITVYSTNADELDALQKLLDPSVTTKTYKVGVVGGDNRYATAVNIAKEQGVLSTQFANGGNIVLVSGESLVDGLSAAPLAAKLKNGTVAAPVLLTKSAKLSTETKEYIESLLPAAKADKKKVNVTIVGGKSVVSDSIVEELEDMGVFVKRLGGANREETSLVVAKEIVNSASNKNAAFVVGGNGEADAMAISAVAANPNAITPIIVSSVHGLTEDALTFLNENSASGDVTIVGGESVVSASEENEINDSLTLNKASRIAGANRFETNAAIIKKYYTEKSVSQVNGIVLAKDGVAKKSELVDALAAANYAASKNAPIVLATNSLSAAQKNELLGVDKVSTFASTAKLVQVGQGVERSVLEEVAKLFGLSNF